MKVQPSLERALRHKEILDALCTLQTIIINFRNDSLYNSCRCYSPKGAKVNVLVNKRAGGNAPLITQMIAEKFLQQE
jgi:hypothetical protein